MKYSHNKIYINIIKGFGCPVVIIGNSTYEHYVRVQTLLCKTIYDTNKSSLIPINKFFRKLYGIK